MKSKMSFKNYAKAHGVQVRNYNADNGRFTDNTFIHDVKHKNQGMTYCGVNAHHQNRKAEKRIRDLQDHARILIMQACYKWPEAISQHLWPYAVRVANETRNYTPCTTSGMIPIAAFSGTEEIPKMSHLHTFGCPAYVLVNELQMKRKIDKWKPRCRVGIYLGPSPSHASSMHLIMSPATGHVSPQFHVTFDDFFETIKQETQQIQYGWQSKAVPSHFMTKLRMR